MSLFTHTGCFERRCQRRLFHHQLGLGRVRHSGRPDLGRCQWWTRESRRHRRHVHHRQAASDQSGALYDLAGEVSKIFPSNKICHKILISSSVLGSNFSVGGGIRRIPRSAARLRGEEWKRRRGLLPHSENGGNMGDLPGGVPDTPGRTG